MVLYLKTKKNPHKQNFFILRKNPCPFLYCSRNLINSYLPFNSFSRNRTHFPFQFLF
ncbi:hypothetical protein NC652_026799 [Populus alba x Populus x berolinensis]|nr:hypothetical protein NC652_026799 [Populus alba x Populus x berolinensis]